MTLTGEITAVIRIATLVEMITGQTIILGRRIVVLDRDAAMWEIRMNSQAEDTGVITDRRPVDTAALTAIILDHPIAAIITNLPVASTIADSTDMHMDARTEVETISDGHIMVQVVITKVRDVIANLPAVNMDAISVLHTTTPVVTIVIISARHNMAPAHETVIMGIGPTSPTVNTDAILVRRTKATVVNMVIISARHIMVLAHDTVIMDIDLTSPAVNTDVISVLHTTARIVNMLVISARRIIAPTHDTVITDIGLTSPAVNTDVISVLHTTAPVVTAVIISGHRSTDQMAGTRRSVHVVTWHDVIPLMIPDPDIVNPSAIVTTVSRLAEFVPAMNEQDRIVPIVTVSETMSHLAMVEKEIARSTSVVRRMVLIATMAAVHRDEAPATIEEGILNRSVTSPNVTITTEALAGRRDQRRDVVCRIELRKQSRGNDLRIDVPLLRSFWIPESCYSFSYEIKTTGNVTWALAHEVIDDFAILRPGRNFVG